MDKSPASWLHKSVCLCRIRCSCTSIAGVILGLVCPAQSLPSFLGNVDWASTGFRQTTQQISVPEVVMFCCCLKPYCSHFVDAAVCSALSQCRVIGQAVSTTVLHHTCSLRCRQRREYRAYAVLQTMATRTGLAYSVSVVLRAESSRNAPIRTFGDSIGLNTIFVAPAYNTDRQVG